MPQNRTVAFISEEDASIQRLALEIARSLVPDEDSITVAISERDGQWTLQVFTDADGFGRLIGSQGRTAQALRTIIGAAAMKLKRRYSLDIQQRIEI